MRIGVNLFRQQRHLLFGAFGALVLALGVFALAPAGNAEACGTPPPLAYGVNRWCGYFYNQFADYGDFVLSGGMNSPDIENPSEFINDMVADENSGNGQNGTGGKFIILTMLGLGGGTPKTVSAAQLADWESRVNGMSSYGTVGNISSGPTGSINWHYPYHFTCGTVNTYYQDAGGVTNDDAPFIAETTNGNCGPNDYEDSVAFIGTNGALDYVLRRECANPIGTFPGLPQAAYTLSSTLVPGSGTPAFGGIVEPGTTYHLTPRVKNPASVASNPFIMEVGNLSTAYVQNAGIASPGPYTTGASYNGGGCQAGAAGCWHWNYGSVPAGASSAQTNGVDFTISNATPDGTKVCFNLTVNPNTQNANTPNTIGPDCFVVYRPHYPAVVGDSGDIHAGGGLCDSATTGTGNIITSSQSDSLGAYVVSASGSVSGIGSNNTAGGTAATLGKTGGYYSVCREDLVAGAQAYINGGGAYTPLGDVTVNLGTLAPGVYLHNSGGTLKLTGTFSNQITIVSLAGTVEISGNVILNAPSTTAANAPSLGIIAAGNINIDAGATRVDAYLFSDGAINTCTQASNACLNTLTVNGFLMGNTINFQRMGPSSSLNTATVGEQVNLTGQIYLNPPKLFSDLSTINLLEAQGERPPIN